MQIVTTEISLQELQEIAKTGFGNLVKAVVDIERKIMAISGELHADEEQLLLENDSQQKDLWGINLYPDSSNDELIEFDSVINLRPSQNNRSRGVDSSQIQQKIKDVVYSLIKK